VVAVDLLVRAGGEYRMLNSAQLSDEEQYYKILKRGKRGGGFFQRSPVPNRENGRVGVKGKRGRVTARQQKEYVSEVLGKARGLKRRDREEMNRG